MMCDRILLRWLIISSPRLDCSPYLRATCFHFDLGPLIDWAATCSEIALRYALGPCVIPNLLCHVLFHNCILSFIGHAYLPKGRSPHLWATCHMFHSLIVSRHFMEDVFPWNWFVSFVGFMCFPQTCITLAIPEMFRLVYWTLILFPSWLAALMRHAGTILEFPYSPPWRCWAKTSCSSVDLSNFNRAYWKVLETA